KTVTEGLVKAIAEEVAVQRHKGISYGANGVQTAHTAAVAITLNKRA
ncbi:MAG: flagellar basal body protein, partial [Proteobacteria bacterium]|nr:flagellar basal body protein [Pseudomonadota bacterium]